MMGDGSHRPISEIKIGDEVLATNPETGELRPQVVTDVIVGSGIKDLVELTIDADGLGNPGHITATVGHPVFVAGREWVDAGELRAGDRAVRRDQLPLGVVTRTRRKTSVATVYNLTVAAFHTFLVAADGEELLVHNCARPPRQELDWIEQDASHQTGR